MRQRGSGQTRASRGVCIPQPGTYRACCHWDFRTAIRPAPGEGPPRVRSHNRARAVWPSRLMGRGGHAEPRAERAHVHGSGPAPLEIPQRGIASAAVATSTHGSQHGPDCQVATFWRRLRCVLFCTWFCCYSHLLDCAQLNWSFVFNALLHTHAFAFFMDHYYSGPLLFIETPGIQQRSPAGTWGTA